MSRRYLHIYTSFDPIRPGRVLDNVAGMKHRHKSHQNVRSWLIHSVIPVVTLPSL